jgi:hypothetical protein
MHTVLTMPEHTVARADNNPPAAPPAAGAECSKLSRGSCVRGEVAPGSARTCLPTDWQVMLYAPGPGRACCCMFFSHECFSDICGSSNRSPMLVPSAHRDMNAIGTAGHASSGRPGSRCGPRSRKGLVLGPLLLTAVSTCAQCSGRVAAMVILLRGDTAA